MVEIMVNRVNLIGYEEGQVDSMAFHCEELSSRFGTISPKVYWHFEEAHTSGMAQCMYVPIL